MTQLAASVDADDELWTLDALPITPFVQVQDELVEVRARFPEHVYLPTNETIPPKIRVRRAQAGTTAASHANGTALTAVYSESSGGGGGGAIAVTDGVTTIPALTSLSVPSSTLTDDGGGEGTLEFGTMEFDDAADGTLTIQAPAGQEDSGNLLIRVIGELGDGNNNELLNFDPYGQLILKGAVVDPTNGGASLVIKNGAGTIMFHFKANDGSGGQGVPKAAFFGGNAVAQPAPIADATDPASTMARLNDVLAALRALGLIDT